MATDHQQALRELYSEDLDRFVVTRDRLASELKDSDPEAASDIKKRRKPSIIVWAVNRTARANKDTIEQLVAAGAAMRAALGSSDAGAAQEWSRKRRALVRSLTDAAAKVLSEGGKASGAANLDRISTTFLVAATDEEAAPELVEAVLDRELRGSELADLGLALGAPDEIDMRTPSKDVQRDLEDAKRSLRELERRAAQLELEADDLQAAARKARRVATEARSDADRAAAKLEDMR